MAIVSLNLVLDALLVAGETSWIWAWSVTVGSWIGGGRAPLLPLPALLILMVAPAVLARLATARGGTRARLLLGVTILLGVQAAVLAAIAQLPLAAGVPASLAALNGWLDGEQAGRAVLAGGAAGIAWRRGLGLGRSVADTTTVDESFGTGIVAFSSLLALVGLSSGATGVSSDALIPPTLVMLMAGLVGMPLARIREVSARPRNRHNPGLPLGGPWLSMLLAVVGMVLVVTLVLARIFTFDRIGAVMDALGSRLDSVLMTVIYVLAIPFGLLVEVLISISRLLIRPGQERPRQQQPGTDWMSHLQEQGGAPAVSPEVLLFLKIAFGVLLVVLFAWLMWRALSRLQRVEDDDVAEERESVWVWPGWSAVWGWLLSQLRPIRARAAALVPHLGADGHAPDRSIRGAYRELLRLGASFGHARHLPETPLEYERRLNRALPAGVEDTTLVTGAYSRAAYGPPSSHPEDPSPALAAVARLRVLFKARAQ